MGTFQVLFSGDLAKGAEQAAVQAALAAELRIDERKARQLFQGRTVVIRNQLEERAALALQQRLFDLGAVCRVKDVGQLPKARLGSQIDRDAVRMEQNKRDRTMRDITAAFVECPRCAHLQLETAHCARCGVDMAVAAADKRREDQLIEQQIRALRAKRSALARDAGSTAGAAPEPPERPRLPAAIARKLSRDT
jgi:hypothetical protein